MTPSTGNTLQPAGGLVEQISLLYSWLVVTFGGDPCSWTYRHVGEGFENWKLTFFLKRSCQIHYFAKDKYVFFYLFMFLFQWTNLRRRLCGSLPTCVLLQLQITSMAQLIAQLYLKTYDHLFIYSQNNPYVHRDKNERSKYKTKNNSSRG